MVLDNLRLFKEPLLRQLAYERGQRHVFQAMRAQYVSYTSHSPCIYENDSFRYRRQFQQSMVVSPLLRNQLEDSKQENVTFVHELTDSNNIDILTKLLKGEHLGFTR